MKTLSSMFVALALLAGTGAASADPWHDQNRGRGHDDRGHDRGYDDHRGHDRDGWRGRDNRDHWDHRYYSDRNYYGRPHWQRGYRYDGPMYIVNDYRGYRLTPPPYGYRWVQNQGSFLLVSIGDGLILDIR